MNTKQLPAELTTWFAARGYTVDSVTGKATRQPQAQPVASEPVDYFKAKAAKRSRQLARQADANKAMLLYSIDNAAYRRGERSQAKMTDYIVWTWADGPREMEATDYARSRFNELPAKRNKRRAA